MPTHDEQSSILDHPAISGRYLFPQPRSVERPFLVKAAGAELACSWRVVDPHDPTLVHFHGNGEAVADYVPDIADDFAEIGLNSLFVEYRQYGASTGRAELAAMLGDGEAAVKAAGLEPSKTIAFGRSIGSLYAIELAARLPDLGGLVIESGIADPAERFLTYGDLASAGFTESEVRAETKRLFDHRRKLAAFRGPLLVMHAEHDGLIDVSHAERNCQWAGGSIKRLVRFPRGNHNSIMGVNRQEYFAALAAFAKTVRRQADKRPS